MKSDKKSETVPSRLWRLVSDVKYHHVLESYTVSQATVMITKDGKYMVNEPYLDADATDAYHTIYDHMEQNAAIIDYQNVSELHVEEAFMRSAETAELSEIVINNKSAMLYYLKRDTIGFRILDVLMNDENIEDITCENPNVPVGVIHRKHPEFFVMDTNITFARTDRQTETAAAEPRNSMELFVKTLMQLTGQYATSISPYVEGSTQNRDRLSAFAESEITPDGPAFCVRRFPKHEVTISSLIKDQVIPAEAAAYVWSLLAANGTGMITGNTGSGKTTILNALISLVNPKWKIVLIEDTEEIRIPQQHGLRLKTRVSTDSFNQEYSKGIGDLLTYSLRQRPQCVVVGEVRLTDVPILFQVFETGHASLSTFHGSSPAKALIRLEAKPIEIMAAQKDDLWFLMHVGRVLQDGVFRRKMLSLVETHLDESGMLKQTEVLSYDAVAGTFSGTDIDEMIQNSPRLRYAATLNGITEIKKDMQKKTECLKNTTATNHKGIMEQIYESYGHASHDAK